MTKLHQDNQFVGYYLKVVWRVR